MAPGRRTVVWADSARIALDDVLTYTSRESRAGAIRVLTCALEAADSLQSMPERGRIVPELGESNLREVFVFRYRLLYRVLPDSVRVVAFLHSARDFAAWQQE